MPERRAATRPLLPPARRPAGAPLLLQRKCACGNHTGGGESCAACEKEKLQRKGDGQGGGGLEIPPEVHAVLRSPGQALDGSARAAMERGFGHDFSDVRLHTGPQAAASARAVNALAYTVGRNVVFGAGQYAPGARAGQRLLAHELAHVVQQRSAGGPTGVGHAHSPLENDADRAAERVVSGQGAGPLAPAASGVLARQAVPAEQSSSVERTLCRGRVQGLPRLPPPSFTGATPSGRYSISRVEAISDNRKRVVLSTGQRYIVQRTPWTRSGTGLAPTVSATPGANRTEVWLQVDWCAGGTEGNIRVGANVPEQAIQLVLGTLRSGGDVASAWERASITPTFSGQLRAGHWQFDLKAQTTVDSSGQATDAQGSAGVSVDLPGGRRVGVEATVGSQAVGGDPLGGVQAGLNLRFDWGGSARPVPDCDRQWTRSGYSYACEEERDVGPSTGQGTRSVTQRDRRAYNLFFRYATDQFDDSRNGEALSALAADLQAGFEVGGIEGWTSPEGGRGPGAGFEGNDALATARAEAARRRVAALCGAANCIASGAVVRGAGERMDVLDEAGQPRDASGRELESHVAGSFGTDPGEASVRSPELMRRLARAGSAHRRAELIYPWLRRAVVQLRRSSTSAEDCTFEIPAHPETAGIGNCPADIRDAAFPGGGTRQ
ncbi:MAG TPA: DUF4157 domain-containing protein [Ideonella sp.]|nr:DUF4157 domain-containing protein [Ideonella sp.]